LKIFSKPLVMATLFALMDEGFLAITAEGKFVPDFKMLQH